MHSFYSALVFTVFLPLSALAAVETWTGPDGLPIQAEFIRRSSDYITFQKPSGSRYLLPYNKLSETDRARVDVLTGRPSTTATPAPVPVAPTTTAEPTPTEDPPKAPAASNKAGKALAPLIGKLVYLKGSTLLPLPQSQLSSIRYVAVYYSAHWCPPCRTFTPKLVSAYKSIKAAHPEFEVIFVSSDEDEDAMKAYMRETAMTWPALRLNQKDNARSLKRPDHERGIPNLVFMTADGKELATTYTPSGEYSGPNQVLAAIQRQFKK